MDERGQKIFGTWKNLKADRVTIDDSYYRRAYEYTLPHRGINFINRDKDGTTNALTAKNYQSKIYDSTAIDAVHTLASSLVTGLVPKNSKWFNLGVLGADAAMLPREVRNWLQDASTTLHKHLHSSNFDIVVDEFFQDICICGYSGLYVEENEDNAADPFRFHLWSPYEIINVDSTGDGAIDTVYRELGLTIQQAVTQYGYENLPEDLQQSYDENPTDKKLHTWVHYIGPRRKGKTGKLAENMEYESLHVHSSGHICRKGGYNELPVIIPRWTVLPNSPYAIGPVNEAMPDIKTVNQVVEMWLSTAEMNIAGTFIARNDGSINPNTTKIGPRRIIFASDVDSMKALTSGSQPQIAQAEIARLQDQIRNAMKVDKLQPTNQPYQTATEVSVNVNLIRQQLGPMYARMTGEFCEPLIRRALNIAIRQGIVPPPPPELVGVDLAIEYQSPLARAARQEEVSAMDMFELALSNIAQVYPDTLDLYDADAALRIRATLLDVPVETLRDEREVEQVRRDQQEEEERMMMQMQAMQQQGTQ